MKIKLVKFLDRAVGGLLTSLLPAPKPGVIRVPRKLLVIRPGGIGDAVLLVPALKALRAAFPDCAIDVLAERRNAAAFAFAGAGLRSVICYDSPGGGAAALRPEYDVVIDTEQWYRLSAVIARISGPPLLIGFATNHRARLFTHAVSYSSERYEPFSFLKLLEPLGIAAPDTLAAPFLELPPAAVAEAQTLLAPLQGASFVAVFPGASVPEKQWGVERFQELVLELVAAGERVVIVGGRDCCGLAAGLSTSGAVLDLAGRCSLAVSAALVGQGRALVSGDSVLLHVAAGLGIPTVSLFGPSSAKKWAPQGERHLALCAGRDCGPCSRFGTIPPCKQSVHCLAEISVAEVRAALAQVLDPEGTTPPAAGLTGE